MKQILIIGLGELGKHLAYKFNELGNEVCIVDNNANNVQLMEESFPNAYIGDCMQKATLEKIGVKNFDICFVCIGSNFQASLEITSNLKELGAKYIIAKAISDLQSKFLIMAGANETIYPEKEVAEKIAIRCDFTNLLDFIEVSDDYGIYEIEALKSWLNKSVINLNIRKEYNVNIIAVRQGKKIIIPDGYYEFQPDDTVLLIGKEKDVRKLTKK